MTDREKLIELRKIVSEACYHLDEGPHNFTAFDLLDEALKRYEPGPEMETITCYRWIDDRGLAGKFAGRSEWYPAHKGVAINGRHELAEFLQISSTERGDV